MCCQYFYRHTFPFSMQALTSYRMLNGINRIATGLISGTLRAYLDPSFSDCNSLFMQSVYFQFISFWMYLLSVATLLPHFRLSADTYPLYLLFMSGWFAVPFFFPVPTLPVASATSLQTGHNVVVIIPLQFHKRLIYSA